MIKKITLMVILFFSGLCFAKVKNPFIGKWQLKVVEGCTETYYFSENGRMLSNSKREVNERRYSFKLLENNIYFVKIKNIKSNELESCYNKISESYLGLEFGVYFKFNKDFDKFEVYFEPDGSDKSGPFIKLKQKYQGQTFKN